MRMTRTEGDSHRSGREITVGISSLHIHRRFRSIYSMKKNITAIPELNTQCRQGEKRYFGTGMTAVPFQILIWHE
jgi:hypothetical protein